jgi:catechol 2,3-dioxygenase-like lactoylglutathione lyase family enzyme
MNHPKIHQQVTFLSTDDLEKTAQFYERILGLDLVLDQGGCRIYRICGDGFLGFCQREDFSPHSSDVVFTMVSSEVDQWYQFLVEKNVEIENPPAENPTYNIYHFFVRDPNGYLLEVQEFLDPTWPN